MIDPLSNQYINWTDGMKISQAHLHKLQQIIEEKSKDTNSVTIGSDNYGVLPFGVDGKKPLDYLLRIEDKSTIHIEVIQCRGISAAGDRIEVLSDSINTGRNSLKARIEVNKSTLINESSFYVCIRRNQKEMTPFGIPDTAESPPRLPYVEPALHIEVIPESSNANLFRNCLVVARLESKNAELRHDEGFIPPSMEMMSHEDLREFAFKYIQFIQEMESNAFAIIRNLGRKDKLTTLAENVGTLARNLITTVQTDIDFIQMFGSSLKPSIYLLNSKKLARAIKNTIELLANEDKEELLNYVQEIIDMSPGEYGNKNATLLSLEYNHLDIRSTLQKILQFCQVNGKLLGELSGLDYIGKKKKSGIFVGEVTKEPEPPKDKKRWDF